MNDNKESDVSPRLLGLDFATKFVISYDVKHLGFDHPLAEMLTEIHKYYASGYIEYRPMVLNINWIKENYDAQWYYRWYIEAASVVNKHHELILTDNWFEIVPAWVADFCVIDELDRLVRFLAHEKR